MRTENRWYRQPELSRGYRIRTALIAAAAVVLSIVALALGVWSYAIWFTGPAI